MRNVLSTVGLDVHKEKVLLALITPHIHHDIRVALNSCHSKTYSMRMCSNGVLLLINQKMCDLICACSDDSQIFQL